MNDVFIRVWRAPCRSGMLSALYGVPSPLGRRCQSTSLYDLILGRMYSTAPIARQPGRLTISPLGPRGLTSFQTSSFYRPFNGFRLSWSRNFSAQNKEELIVHASDHDLAHLFGKENVSNSERYTILCELQRRRIDGTLDLDPTAEMKKVTDERILNDALEWLRARFPMDEDAAILRRIEREEKEMEEQLIQRAENLGLYKPQGGEYQESLSNDGDVRGQSVLEEVRKQNEAKAKLEQEEERKRWLEGELEEQKAIERQQQQLMKQNLELQKSEEARAVLTEGTARL